MYLMKMKMGDSEEEEILELISLAQKPKTISSIYNACRYYSFFYYYYW